MLEEVKFLTAIGITSKFTFYDLFSIKQRLELQLSFLITQIVEKVVPTLSIKESQPI